MATSTSSSTDSKLQMQIDRARLETARLRELLTAERSSMRLLKAAHQADIRKIQSTSKIREEELKKQLIQTQRTQNKNDNNNENCEECKKIRNEFEAELRREKSEMRKREHFLTSQLNELKNFKTEEQNCEECQRLQNTFDNTLKRQKQEFQKKENELKAQIKELKTSSVQKESTKTKDCQSCLKLRSTVSDEISRLKDECLKLKQLHELETKNRQDFKNKENSLNLQITDLTKELNSYKSKYNEKIDELSSLRKTSDFEIKKLKLEFRTEKSCLMSQINDLKSNVLCTSDIKLVDCDQCSRYKASFEAEIKNLKKEFKKREEQLQIQLVNAQRILCDGKIKKGSEISKNDCECFKVNRELTKYKENIKILEEKIEKLQESDRLKSTELRIQHDRHLTELAKITRSATQDTRKLLEELKTKDRIIEQLRRNVQTNKKPIQASENASMRKLREGDRKIEATPNISSATFDPKNENHIYDEVPQTNLKSLDRPQNNNLSQSHQQIITDVIEVSSGDTFPTEPGDLISGPQSQTDVSELDEDISNCNLQPNNTYINQQHVMLHLKHYNKEADRRDQLTAKQRREMYFRSSGHELEPVLEEDTDSALSSAPSSLSPQPYAATPCFGAVVNGQSSPPPGDRVTLPDDRLDHPSGSGLSGNSSPSEAYTSPSISPPPQEEDVWKPRESELSIAKRQVRELEKALLVTRGVKSEPSRQGQVTNALTERIRTLEAREASLISELGDLREQNELLEFRILELEECHDKWSLRSTSPSSGSNGTNGVGSSETTTRRECTDADSGVGSVCLEPEERIRARLLALAQSETAQPEDRDCLMRVLALLDGLEQLSREPHVLGEDRTRTSPIQTKSQQFGYTPREKQPNRIVATVLPFTDYQQEEEDYIDQEGHSSDLPEKYNNNNNNNNNDNNKKLVWNNLCLQESGIFDGEPPEFNTQGTQTDPYYHESPQNKTLDLTAEIQKLNQFRESIEVSNKAKKLLVSSDQRYTKEINFYKSRLEFVERKLQVYESSGDLQTKLLRDRLNKELYLTSQVKDLTTKVQKLHSENSRLEEERCELEEAENDTRLRCQQLEAEIETLADRLRAMEDSKLAAKRKAKDAKSQASYWESVVSKFEKRNYELEERECELRHRLEVMECATPALMMFNMWKTLQNNPDIDMKELFLEKFKELKKLKHDSLETSLCTCASEVDEVKQKIKTLENERNKLISQKQKTELKVEELEKELESLKSFSTESSCGDQEIKVSPSELELIQELQERKKRIAELEQREMAYIETLEKADDIWVEMEAGYKKRINEAEQIEQQLRQKLQKYEKSDDRDDKIQELEQTEKSLQNQIARLEKKVQQLLNSNKLAKEEFDNCILNLEEKLSSTEIKLTTDLEKEKKKYKTLSDELKATQQQKLEAGKLYESEISSLKEQLSKTRKELIHLDVTNSELREEVYTLESKISEMDKEMQTQRNKDNDTIKSLSKELNSKDKELQAIQRKSDITSQCSCARGELSIANNRIGVNEVTKKINNVLQHIEKSVENSDTTPTELLLTMKNLKSLYEQMESQSTQGDVPKTVEINTSEHMPKKLDRIYVQLQI